MAETYLGKVCAKHPELNGERLARRYVCPACEKEYQAAYYQERRQRTGFKEAKQKYMVEYHKSARGRELKRVHRAQRRALKKQAAVPLTEHERLRIKQIYDLAKINGKDVDHIKPLAKGGLHHPDNLQMLDPKVNRRKGTKEIHPLFLWQLEEGVDIPPTTS